MYNLSIMTKYTNELIAGFVFLTLRIWITVAAERDQNNVGPAEMHYRL